MKFIESFATALAVVAFSLFIAVAMLDWAGGCGESYIQADGSRVAGECKGREIVFNFFK